MNHRKIAFVFLLLGSLCAILAFSTTSWMELSHNGLKIHIGLWRMCSTNCSDLNGIVLRWYGFVQATACIGLVGTIVVSSLLGLCHYVERFQKNIAILRFTAVTCIITWKISGYVVFVLSWIRRSSDAMFNEDLIYMGLPAIKTDRADISYSFFIAVFGAQFTVLAGIILFQMMDVSKQGEPLYTEKSVDAT
ncbi:uncharacterized protein LOC128175831 [Crassostrea angulata]|uniref:uncharacterized protein LOC128175831 n=1 Tax=Magallana angulata TaxID=2784310 RepID=UPI0022B18228|nr:uncharacterized protein LOC128175831 [Crassostrea angulata]